jgi:hypothetical protein
MPRRWARGKVFFLDARAAGKARTGIRCGEARRPASLITSNCSITKPSEARKVCAFAISEEVDERSNAGAGESLFARGRSPII